MIGLRLIKEQLEIARVGVSNKVNPKLSASKKVSVNNQIPTDNLVLTTLGSSHQLIGNFDLLIVDEAAQAVEPELMATIIKTRSKKVLLIGDDHQLPPTCVSIEAAQAGLSLSLFGRLKKQLPDVVVLLRHQYRMHPEIFAFVNDNVYGGLLLSNSAPTDFILQPYTFLDLPISLESRNGISFQNEAEALFVSRLLIHVREKAPEASIGVIVPYRGKFQ